MPKDIEVKKGRPDKIRCPHCKTLAYRMKVGTKLVYKCKGCGRTYS